MLDLESRSQVRPEQEIFEELATLCVSPGYVHAIAFLCYRDNTVRYKDEVTVKDMEHLFSPKRLLRTEISTLIGLLIKGDIDYQLPTPNVMQQYLERTETLLEEIHRSMIGNPFADLDPAKIMEENFNPFANGSALREPIFYGGESAYSFQYRDLSPRKYAADDDWLMANKGFSIQTARDIVYAIGNFLNEKPLAVINSMREQHPSTWTILPGHTFCVQDVAERAQLDTVTVTKVLTAFAVPEGERNKDFSALHDFNVANALPLLHAGGETYILFHIYGLVEALYEAPFYWMGADEAYVPIAMKHRGEFTEGFSAERLVHVFGRDNVYTNVDIFESKSTKVGEIDVLVIFGNRAIVLQAKSKRLTLEARRGNDGQIRKDFRESVQHSCDQGFSTAKLLGNPKYKLLGTNSREVAIPRALKEVYVLCVVSDHYPALSFQARQFLKFEATSTVPPPFVLDVFTLDAMTEMLSSPLRLLSYLDRRAKYSDKLLASHELTILSYHLKKNLWLDNEYDMVMLEDDISIDLDIAMMARRENVPGKLTPDGILTRLEKTALGNFLQEIEARPDPRVIDFGFMLLTLGESTVVDVNKCINKIAAQARSDGKPHDVTMGLGTGDTGLTIHCNNDSIGIAGPRLEGHCTARKYTERANTWFGVCILPKDTSLRFGLNLEYEWMQSDEMDVATRDMRRPSNVTELLSGISERKRKIGRNDPCACGSGKKYKKCCLK